MVSAASTVVVAANVLLAMVSSLVLALGAFGLARKSSIEASVCFGSIDVENISVGVLCTGIGMLFAALLGLWSAVTRSRTATLAFSFLLLASAAAIVLTGYVLLFERGFVVDRALKSEWDAASNKDAVLCLQGWLDCCGYSGAHPQDYGCPGGGASGYCRDSILSWLATYTRPSGIALLVIGSVQVAALIAALSLACSSAKTESRAQLELLRSSSSYLVAKDARDPLPDLRYQVDPPAYRPGL